MSEADKAVVEAQVKAKWPGERVVPRRGVVFFPPVREGGSTDICIKMAAEIADAHYRKVIRDLIRGTSDHDGWVKVYDWAHDER